MGLCVLKAGLEMDELETWRLSACFLWVAPDEFLAAKTEVEKKAVQTLVFDNQTRWDLVTTQCCICALCNDTKNNTAIRKRARFSSLKAFGVTNNFFTLGGRF